jgi:hypothetical protein
MKVPTLMWCMVAGARTLAWFREAGALKVQTLAWYMATGGADPCMVCTEAGTMNEQIHARAGAMKVKTLAWCTCVYIKQ